MQTKKTAIIGTVGIPAGYGGFETLAEHLARYHQRTNVKDKLIVYCTSFNNSSRLRTFAGAELRYIPIPANGVLSVAYDVISLLHAVIKGCDNILVLGVSGAVALPLIRCISGARIVTNVDGIEWRRQKWRGPAKWWLRQSEKWAAQFSHSLVADNQAIADHLLQSYEKGAVVIAYGGDHAKSAPSKPFGVVLPDKYVLALCRIEPENNVELILDAFAGLPEKSLVFVGNWDNGSYARSLRSKYSSVPHLHLLDPVYDVALLRTIRDRATMYVHGHSAGGTNPSLVEMMHFAVPIIAYNCSFNRHTTENRALYFTTAEELRDSAVSVEDSGARTIGKDMLEIAARRYTWAIVGQQYFSLLSNCEDGDLAR